MQKCSKTLKTAKGAKITASLELKYQSIMEEQEEQEEQSRSLLMKTNRRKEEESRAAAGPQPADSTPEHPDSTAGERRAEPRKATKTPRGRKVPRREKQPEDEETYPGAEAPSPG